MKLRHLLSFAASLAAWMLFAATSVSAQTFTVLHTFGTGTDGVSPENVVCVDNTLYGTTYAGGTNNSGTVFSINTDGSDYTVLHSFGAQATDVFGDPQTNADGTSPEGPLIAAGGTLYGTAMFGGTNGWGTIYAITTNDSNFSVLYTFPGFTGTRFTNLTGNNPEAGLLLSGGTLYGLNSNGGTNRSGTLFSIDTDGGNYQVLFNFDKSSDSTNTDGASPANDLIQVGDTLYTAAGYGGAGRVGTVFSYDTNDAVFTVLHTFNGFPDGANPFGPVTASGNLLYGTAVGGGTNDWGCVYSLPIAGGATALLHSFTPDGNTPFTNTDGTAPQGALALVDGWLYGTANAGGAYDNGDVFYAGINTGNFDVLHYFSASNTNLAGVETNSDGAGPTAGVIVNGNTLYGVTLHGGTNGDGTVFSLTLPVLAISSFNLAGSNLVINATGGLGGATCSVLASTNLTLALNQWTAIASNSLGNTGNFTITATNAVSAGPGQQFYVLQEQ